MDQYGFQVTRDYKDALRIDKHNGNSKWQEMIVLEFDHIKETKFSRTWDLHPAITLSSSMHPRTTRRSKSTLCLLSNTMDATRQVWLQMDTSPETQLRQFTQELFHYVVSGLRCYSQSSTNLSSDEQILAMHTSRPTPGRNSLLWLDLNLMTWKDTFFSWTGHCTEHKEQEHGGMTTLLMS